MGFFLAEPVDFARHNEEVTRVWEAYRERRPYRVPVRVIGSISNLFGNPAVNHTGLTFEDFFTDPQAQIDAQLAYDRWVRYHWICDREMGPPSQGWQLRVDFQNSYEAGWFGAPLKFAGDAVPDTIEILKENPAALYDMPDPDPLRDGLMGRAVEFCEYMSDRCRSLEFEGRPVLPPSTLPGEGTDGPFTIACKLRGLAECCLDMYENPRFFHDLMAYVTRNTIRRMKAVREWRWARSPSASDRGRYRSKDWGFADDAIAMLSPRQYQEHVFPYHRQLAEEFGDGPISIHLCGDATHHFPFLHEHLNVQSFDTGFPVDFARLRRQLGPGVEILGGPTIMLLREGTPKEVREEVRRICASGIMEGGRFILREANNLAPCTPIENLQTMYVAAMEFGRYA